MVVRLAMALTSISWSHIVNFLLAGILISDLAAVSSHGAEEDVTDTDGSWKCMICGKKTKNKGHLKEHTEVHFEGLNFSCSDCDYICSTRNRLRQHAYKHKE